jgi:DNA-binding PadR family transcriptional regulator
MTVALGDVLLVLLGDGPATAYELRLRHAETFGSQESVDIARVVPALTRQERLGFVRTDGAPGRRRRWQLTDAGHRRQRTWLLDVRDDVPPAEIRIRGLLAVAVTDRATFDTVIGSCLATLELQQMRTKPAPSTTLSAHFARSTYRELLAEATLDWLRGLRAGHRARDDADSLNP